MLGDRRGGWTSFLRDCLICWQSVPPEGKEVNLMPAQFAFLPGISRDFFHAALLDMFGLMRIEFPKADVIPWAPAGIDHLPFGDAVFTLLAGHALSSFAAYLDLEEEAEAEAGEEIAFGHWQPLFQPYFPAWRDNLTLSADEPRSGVFVFRVSLGKTWRRIAIQADGSLHDLLYGILASVDFDDDHLYEFRYRDRFGALVRADDPRGSRDGVPANEVRIGDLPLEPGQSMELTYDFGDNWRFAVKLESIGPPDKRLKKPRLLEKKGKSPEQYPYAEGW
jgi:hypothetical protein